MKVFKIIFSFSLIFIFNSANFAQKDVDYQDVYDVIITNDNEKAYTLLLAYQRQDPEFANSYFQLGLISKKWALNFNPFTEFELTKHFIYNTKLYFNLAKLKLENEKKKNRDLYRNSEIKIEENQKLSNEDIIGFIDEQVKEIAEYEKNIVQIVNHFNSSSDKYNECVHIFMDINAEYSKIKNIYLTQEEDFFSKLDQLESNFDSTLFCFRQYKNALKKYPIAGYDQNYTLKEIVTYRLDGLTNSNFLENEFLLWNYKKWVQEVKETKKVKVSGNRNELLELEKRIKSKIKLLSESGFSDDYKPYKLDEKFVYRIEKFDNNSLLVKLFKLNAAKINYLSFSKKILNDPVNSDKFSLFKYAQYSNELIEKKSISDSLNNDFKNSINANQIRKYKNFYMTEYNGLTGLKDYAFRQEIFFKENQKRAFENLEKKLFETSFDFKNDSLIFKNKLLDIKKTFPDKNKIVSGEYYVSDFKIDKNNSIILTGFYKTSNATLAGFTGLSKNRKKFNLIKTSEISDTSDILNTVFDDFKGGYFTIETSIGESIVNTLIKYTDKGQVELKKVLPYSKIPRCMRFDDINNTITIVFYGSDTDVLKSDDDEQTLYFLNLSDESQSYTLNFKARSYTFDIIKMDERIFLFGNFIYYVDPEGNKVFSSAGNSNAETNILITVISNEGSVEKYVPVVNNNAFFGAKAIKLNSNTINILGYQSTFENKDYKLLKDKKLYYLLINSNAEIIYSTWHD